MVATDLAESFRAGLSPHLSHARRVADPFHVVRVANRCVDKVRRRVQNDTLGHRGRKHDPLYRIRKLLLAGNERLDQRGSNRMLLGLRVGDPHDEVLGAWLAKESVRDVYLTEDPAVAATLLDKAIAGYADDDVEEIRSLANTLASWRTEILAHHDSGASNGPTEGLNLCVKRVKRCGHGFKRFEHYRLRVLLHAGGVTWPQRPRPTSNPNPRSPLRRVGPLCCITSAAWACRLVVQLADLVGGGHGGTSGEGQRAEAFLATRRKGRPPPVPRPHERVRWPLDLESSITTPADTVSRHTVHGSRSGRSPSPSLNSSGHGDFLVGEADTWRAGRPRPCLTYKGRGLYPALSWPLPPGA